MAATTPASTEQKPKVDLGILEEDDEFEEFPTEGKPRRNPSFILVFVYLL